MGYSTKYIHPSASGLGPPAATHWLITVPLCLLRCVPLFVIHSCNCFSLPTYHTPSLPNTPPPHVPASLRPLLPFANDMQVCQRLGCISVGNYHASAFLGNPFGQDAVCGRFCSERQHRRGTERNGQAVGWGVREGCVRGRGEGAGGEILRLLPKSTSSQLQQLWGQRRSAESHG